MTHDTIQLSIPDRRPAAHERGNDIGLSSMAPEQLEGMKTDAGPGSMAPAWSCMRWRPVAKRSRKKPASLIAAIMPQPAPIATFARGAAGPREGRATLPGEEP
jgi:hypothetical protein